MSRAVRRFVRVNPHLPSIVGLAGCIVYKIIGSLENQLTVNTFYYSSVNIAPNTSQLTTLLAAISTNLMAAYRACVSADWTCTLERIDVVHRNDLNGVQSLANAAAAGTRGAGHFPTEVAITIARSSLVKGQHGRGRISLPAVPLADVTASNITAVALVNNLLTLCAQMKLVASDGANNWTPSIAERSVTSPKLVIGASAITACSPRTLLGTCRRRKIGRGK